MGERSTGRQMLRDLETRVTALEGSQGNPVVNLQQAADALAARLAALEADYTALKAQVDEHIANGDDDD